ncbi:unnamed protein product [Brassicogethes aeneus]|uniref:Ankyrin repeat domain-containing protein 33B n=1 Tax=Brassicogethes aeneus TaxID=1431903 RepID=A0A9P0ASY2_BRAAE|nr:unnamed protein product [Brassicogethes aeneus]
MMLSRNGMIHPCIKEVIFITGVPQKPRPITKRVSELPSLRYGPIGAKTTGTGPLRVTSHYNSDTFPKRSSKNTNGNGYSSVDDLDSKPRMTRRVRFSLPPADGDEEASGGVETSCKSGDRGWTTRVSFSRRSDVARRSESAAKFSTFVNNNVDSVSKRTNRTSYTLSSNSGSVVQVTASPGPRIRVHPTGRYVKGTLSPTANAGPQAASSPGGEALLRAARDGEDGALREYLRRAALVGIPEADLNAVDGSGRTVLSHTASNGSIDLLEIILQLPGLDPNKADNEGNTPLHFVAQAGQIECLNCMLSRCRGIEIDARNYLGFTPLMKAALQGRNKCAKLLLFAGANPTLRDNGRGFRADQWARFCGRYVCADVIEKHARQRLLERSTSYGNWGGENEIGARVLMGKVVPVPPMPQQTSHGLKSKLRKVFRTSSGPGNTTDAYSSARLVTQLTSAALCASSPVLPSAPTVPPVVKSLLRPITVPRLQITLVNNNGDFPNNNISNGVSKAPPVVQCTSNGKTVEEAAIQKPVRMKKKK